MGVWIKNKEDKGQALSTVHSSSSQLIDAMQTFTTLVHLVCVRVWVLLSPRNSLPLAPVTVPPKKLSNPNETPEARADALTSSGRLCCRLQEREVRNYGVVCRVTPDQRPEAHLSSPPPKTTLTHLLAACLEPGHMEPRQGTVNWAYVTVWF